MRRAQPTASRTSTSRAAYTRDVRRIRTMTAAVVVFLAAQMLLAQTRMKPTAPGTAGDPVWQGVLQHTDGRTFVTDGGFAIDAALAKPGKLPQRQYPSKLLEQYFSEPHQDECGVEELQRDPAGKTYTAPAGLALNATYVDFLRRVVPASSLRFRTSGRTRPIVVLANGQIVGVLLPVAQVDPPPPNE